MVSQDKAFFHLDRVDTKDLFEGYGKESKYASFQSFSKILL